MLVKFLYGGSLLACILALIVVAGGHVERLESFFAPGGGLERGARQAARTPIERAQGTTSKLAIENLRRELRAAVAGQQRMSARELRRSLLNTSSGDVLRKPLGAGGATIGVVRGGTMVLLCSKPSRYHCYSFDLRSQQEADSYAQTLKRARAQAMAGRG